MNDTKVILEGHTKKYNIPMSHLEHKYIQHCTDGTELEQIYKELISGEEGSFPMLEQLTFDRIKNIQPNSQILRQDRPPLDRSTINNNEPQQLHDFLNNTSSFSTVQEHQINGNDLIPSPLNDQMDNSTLPVSPVPVINKTNKRIVPKNSRQWGKFEQQISREFNSDNENNSSDEDEQLSNNSHSSDQNQEKSPLLHTAEQHRLYGNIALKSNNYQQSIDSYTKSLTLDKNSIAYMNRAIAYLKLDNYDASIQDCSQVLSTNSQHMKALFCRASCFLVKQQYDEAKHDLNILLTIDSDNNEAQNLLNTITNVQKTNNTQIIDNNEPVDSQTSIISSLNIPILEIEEEEDEQRNNQPMNIDIPQRQNIHSENASPSMFDRENRNRFPYDDDDDDMPLGDEAGAGLPGNLSDEEGYVSRSLNVSPTMDEESDAPELVDHKRLQTPPSTPPTRQLIQNNAINHTIAFTNDGKDLLTITHHRTDDDTIDLFNDLSENNKMTTKSNKSSSYKQNTRSSNPFDKNDDDDDDDDDDTFIHQQSSTSNTTNDAISKSNFSSTIQNWLRDTVKLQSSHHSSSYYERPWSRSMRPWSTDKVQRDIDRFNRFNDFPNVIEASKKMLNSGVLDYHQHAEYIIETLVLCSQWYLKRNDYVHAIQYATEALQYNKTDSDALISRAKAFQNEKLLLFSYADYARIKSIDFSYQSTLHAREKLTIDLKSIEGETWREKLPVDTNDDERYLTYIKIQDNYSETNSYEWYQTHADQFYLDACFVLAIRCYTYCIEIKSDIILAYLKRATCYLKVFEPQKSIDDCNMVLKENSKNLNALYCKACAFKMIRDYRSYELTLKEYLKLQPNNQIILAEYYTSRHEQIPRKKRRIRMGSTPAISNHTIEEDTLSFEELEQIRSEELLYSSLESNNIKEQCSFILHLPDKNNFIATTELIKIVIKTSRIMIQAEQDYQQQHRTSILPFSYTQYCFNILVELTTLPEIETAVEKIDEHYRALLDDLVSYYSSISTVLNNVEKLNDLKKL